MKTEYKEWIQANYPDQKSCFGSCHAAAKQMHMAFPELSIITGTIVDGAWGTRFHAWLTDGRGNVVDPTIQQYPAPDPNTYQEVLPKDRPLGRCRDCGGLIYPGDESSADFCSFSCRANTMSQFQSL